MSKHNLILSDRYSGTTFLLRKITKQHQKFDHAWNDRLDMTNNTIFRYIRGIISAITIFYFAQHTAKMQSNLK